MQCCPSLFAGQLLDLAQTIFASNVGTYWHCTSTDEGGIFLLAVRCRNAGTIQTGTNMDTHCRLTSKRPKELPKTRLE